MPDAAQRARRWLDKIVLRAKLKSGRHVAVHVDEVTALIEATERRVAREVGKECAEIVRAHNDREPTSSTMHSSGSQHRGACEDVIARAILGRSPRSKRGR